MLKGVSSIQNTCRRQIALHKKWLEAEKILRVKQFLHWGKPSKKINSSANLHVGRKLSKTGEEWCFYIQTENIYVSINLPV